MTLDDCLFGAGFSAPHLHSAQSTSGRARPPKLLAFVGALVPRKFSKKSKDKYPSQRAWSKFVINCWR
jgi:hypothetical protein